MENTISETAAFFFFFSNLACVCQCISIKNDFESTKEDAALIMCEFIYNIMSNALPGLAKNVTISEFHIDLIFILLYSTSGSVNNLTSYDSPSEQISTYQISDVRQMNPNNLLIFPTALPLKL